MLKWKYTVIYLELQELSVDMKKELHVSWELVLTHVFMMGIKS